MGTADGKLQSETVLIQKLSLVIFIEEVFRSVPVLIDIRELFQGFPCQPFYRGAKERLLDGELPARIGARVGFCVLFFKFIAVIYMLQCDRQKLPCRTYKVFDKYKVSGVVIDFSFLEFKKDTYLGNRGLFKAFDFGRMVSFFFPLSE